MLNRAALAAAIVTAAALQLHAFWPGVILPDAIQQFAQALSGDYDDWHPVAVTLTWRALIAVHASPAPMLVLQVALYWGGFGLLSLSALRRGRVGLAWSLAALGLLPIGFGLFGTVIKDDLMAGACLLAAGLIANGWRAGRIVAILLLAYAAAVRPNAAFAAAPLIVAALAVKGRWRQGIALVVLVPLLIAVGPLLARAVEAKRSQIDRVLMLYDLGGISAQGEADALPPMPIADKLAANRRCYSTLMWDPYEYPCPITYDSFVTAVDATGRSATALWIEGIARHPLGYAKHRLAHFNRNVRWLVPEDLGGATYVRSDRNPWGFAVERNLAAVLVYHAALWMQRTPFGWPCVWMAVAAGLVIIAARLPSRRLVVPLAGSALLYSLGYLVVGISSDLRYHLWSMMAAYVAAAFAADDLMRDARPERRALIGAVALLVIAVGPAVAWRLLALPPPGA